MNQINISDAEWDVMQVVWSLNSATAADVIEALSEETGWSHRTIRTLLSRLVQKGALIAEDEGHRHRYRPKVSQQRCVREAGQSFLEKIFASNPAELLVHFVRNSQISPDEIERLKQLLDEKLENKE